MVFIVLLRTQVRKQARNRNLQDTSPIDIFTTHKFDNNGINANFVFPYICSFLHYFDLNMLVNNKLDVSWQRGLPFKVGNFIGLLNFEWYREKEIAEQ